MEAPVNPARVATPVEAGGELHRTELPCRRGDKVEAIVVILEQPSRPAQGAERDKARAAAVDQFLARARSSLFHSASPYRTDDGVAVKWRRSVRRAQGSCHAPWRDRFRNRTALPYSWPSSAARLACSISSSSPSLLVHAPDGSCLAAGVGSSVASA
jgi:hypothetical protein